MRKLQDLQFIRVVNKISYNYSTEDSYYIVMLKLCGDYNSTDDAAEQKNTRGNIKDITDDFLVDVNIILSRIEKVRSALEAFEKSGQTSQSTLEGLETSMATILNTELGNIEDLENDIAAHQKDINGYEDKIDHGACWAPSGLASGIDS